MSIENIEEYLESLPCEKDGGCMVMSNMNRMCLRCRLLQFIHLDRWAHMSDEEKEAEYERRDAESPWKIVKCPNCGHRQYDHGDPKWAAEAGNVVHEPAARWHCNGCWAIVTSSFPEATADEVAEDDARRAALLKR